MCPFDLIGSGLQLAANSCFLAGGEGLRSTAAQPPRSRKSLNRNLLLKEEEKDKQKESFTISCQQAFKLLLTSEHKMSWAHPA